MKYLALIRRKSDQFTDEQIAPYLEPEAERVRTLYAQGVIRAAHSFGGEVKGAAVELECSDLEQAHEVVRTLPFAQQGMIDYEIIPLLPYRGFGPRHV